ncbi:MAG: NAD+ synthase [Candidatus Aminicenantales bacterium]
MTINPPFVEKVLCRFIKEELSKFGFRRGIIGLSGGLDSSVCATLAARALGAKQVLGLILPYKDVSGEDIQDAQALAGILGIRTQLVDISPMVDAYFSRYPTKNRVRIGNKMARERMSILYDQSAREKALILGTSNKAELLLGYGTIHGDMACAINPLGDLYKTQVRALAAHLRLPAGIIKKIPTAGLWPGQTDEGEIGLSYAEIDRILYALVDERQTPDEAIASGFKKEAVRKIESLIIGSEFKRKMPPIAKISSRTVGHDFLYSYDRNR